MGFVEYPSSITVHRFELSGEFAEEFLVLNQLVGKDSVHKLAEADPTLQFDLLSLGVFLVSSQLSCRLHPSNKVVKGGVTQVFLVANMRLVYTSGEEVGTELVLFRLLLRLDQLVQLIYDHSAVSLVVHLDDKLFPDRFLQLTIPVLFLLAFHHSVKIFLAL